MSYMFYNVTLSTTNYDALLVGWSTQSLQSNVSFHGGNSKYSCSSTDARSSIIGSFGWTITDGGIDNSISCTTLSNSTIEENLPVGTEIGTFTSTDTPTYSLVSGNGDTDNDSFTISGDTLKSGVIFDYETDSIYSIRVQTDDGNGGAFSESFTITINDVNDYQTIGLESGWNIISFYVIPDTMNLLNILDSLVTSGELLKSIDEAGGFIQNIPGVGWMNTIGDMANTEGYYIKVANNTSLDATGSLVNLPYNIPLNTGWNIMGYPSDVAEDAIIILDDLITADVLIKVINEAGGFIQEIPSVGWMNTIGDFEGGEGYYIKVVADTTLTIEVTSPTWQCGDPLEDPRDGQTYNTVQIGTQCWMAENLNVGTRIDGVNNQTDNSTIEKYCYDDDVANCDTYGGLYQWDEMMQYVATEGVQGICPNDWHLPTDDEWKTMEMELGMTQVQADAEGWRGTDEGGKMKETGTTHWWSPNTGATNSSGFTALSGSHRSNSNGSFYYLGRYGYWWSSSETSGTFAWYLYLYYDDAQVGRDSNGYSNYGFSVHCLKN